MHQFDVIDLFHVRLQEQDAGNDENVAKVSKHLNDWLMANNYPQLIDVADAMELPIRRLMKARKTAQEKLHSLRLTGQVG